MKQRLVVINEEDLYEERKSFHSPMASILHPRLGLNRTSPGGAAESYTPSFGERADYNSQTKKSIANVKLKPIRVKHKKKQSLTNKK